MRYNDFKLVESKRLFEAANAGLEAQHAIHDIEAISDAVPTMDPQLKASIISNLQNLASKVGDFVAKNIKQTQPAQQPQAQPQAQAQPNDPNATVEEAVAEVNNEDQEAQAALAKLKADIAAIEASNIDDKIKAGFLASLNETLDKLTKASENITASRDTARSERDEAINFVKEVTGVLVTLGNKVQGFQEDTDTESMTARDRASFKKMAVNAEKFTKTLKQALFGKILDMQEKTEPAKIKQFLEACVAGKVINMINVIAKDKGSIKDHVNPEFKEVFDVFVEENIFSYAPGTTSGAIGPGEMALSMMGNPAEKGKKGDLKIGDEEVEIKASAKTGGRFNSKKITITPATTQNTTKQESSAQVRTLGSINNTSGTSGGY